MGKRKPPAGRASDSPLCATARLGTTCQPSSRRACSRVPRSKQLTTKSSDASIRFFFASASVLPWVVMSNGGQCAMYQPSSFLRTPKSLNSAWTATRIEKHWGEVKVRVKLYPLNRCNVNVSYRAIQNVTGGGAVETLRM